MRKLPRNEPSSKLKARLLTSLQSPLAVFKFDILQKILAAELFKMSKNNFTLEKTLFYILTIMTENLAI